MTPFRFSTLADLLGGDAQQSGRTASVNFINDDIDRRVPVDELRRRALYFAVSLRERGVARQERVLLSLPTSPDFIIAFFGVIFAGAVPCPLAMPAGFGSLIQWGDRLANLARYLDASRIIVDSSLAEAAQGVSPPLQVIVASSEISATPEGQGPPPVPVTPPDIAFIQCTSGTTGASKGVTLTHGNLIANLHQIQLRLRGTPDDVSVSWLPLYHDMGLIGFVLFPLYCGMDLSLLAPSEFLRKPASWLRALSRQRGTLASAPNFAYKYVTSRAKDAQLEGVDLSSWRAAMCGSEPIDQLALRQFEERFSRYGFRPNTHLPCYGLAEASLAVSMCDVGSPIKFQRLDRDRLAKNLEAHEVGSNDEQGVDVVSCGREMDGTTLRIVDDAGSPLPVGRVGRILAMGPSVMQGYFRLADATAEVLQDGWLDTGDLGYLRDGELYITGRRKDTIIIRGRCYSPTDFEWVAERIPGVRPSTAIAFGVRDEVSGTELLCLVCETDLQTTDEARAELAKEVAAQVAEQTGTRPEVVRFVRRHSTPKTTSGKLQRSRAREMFLSQEMNKTWRPS